MDLPIERPFGVEDWAKVVTRAIPAGAKDVVVVGHSMSGLVVPHVALARPVRHVVFLSAVFPHLPRTAKMPATVAPPSLPDTWGEGIYQNEDGSTSWDPAVAVRYFYTSCDAATAKAAAAKLRRQHFGRLGDTLRKWPATPVSAIHGDADKTNSPAYMRWAAENVLGVTAAELSGDHSLMLSNTEGLADALARI